MITNIKIHTGSTGWVNAVIDSTRNPNTCESIITALPVTASAQLWGDEIYFSIPVEMEEEDAQVEVNIGDLAYWPPGNSFCIFFGKTPASRGEKPAAASAVNVFGKLTENASVLKNVMNGETVTIKLA